MSVKDNMENWIYPIKERFKLSENFIKEYEGVEPEWGPLGKLTYKRTYAARVEGEDRTEEWWETVKRVVEACYTIQLNHCKNLRLLWAAHKAQKSAQEMYTRMFNFKFIPPGRGLANMGDVVFKRGSMGLFNCSAVSTNSTNFSDPYVFMMDVSMCGVGVGFDTEGAGKFRFVKPKTTDKPFVVEDSREGWCEVLRVVLESYVGKEHLPTTIDYSQIRPTGSPIVTSGGIAPGPQPLIDCIEKIQKLMAGRVDNNITSSDIVDIMNVVGVCVVAGGKRRTAQIAFGNYDDKEYISLKDPDLYSEELMSHRWASNNSIYAEDGMDYTEIIDTIKKSGEPGILYKHRMQNYGRMKDGYQEGIDGKATLLNPCGEISLESEELCNISDVFPARHDSFEDFKRSIKYAFLYCKTVTLVPTHLPTTNSKILKNRRIGISQSGIVQAIQKHGATEYFKWCDHGYKYLRNLDKKYSDWLCIQRSIKLSTVKPAGSTSLLMGATPGIHFEHSEYYIRRIRIEETNTQLVQAVKNAGYNWEVSAYGDRSIVFEVPVKAENFYKGKSDVSVWEQMQLGSKIQSLWSDNSVSQTVTFTKDESEYLKNVIEMYEDQFKTVSFLPLSEHGYVQAPYETITVEQFEEMSKKIKPINFDFKQTQDIIEKFCDGDKCTI
jgi:ribonucleoside-triphosphate reductase